MKISGFLMHIYKSVCMSLVVELLGCMGYPDDGTGGRCGQCEFICMNTLLSEERCCVKKISCEVGMNASGSSCTYIGHVCMTSHHT